MTIVGRPVARDSIRDRVGDAFEGFIASSPSRFAIVVFFALVLVFTLLFSLPISTTSGQQAPLVDALFTAVSVICVTGDALVIRILLPIFKTGSMAMGKFYHEPY